MNMNGGTCTGSTYADDNDDYSNFNKELHYLNKEDRLLRWLLVKHRDTKYGLEFISEDDAKGELNKIPRTSFYDEEEEEDEGDDEEECEEEETKE